jgi:transcription elongation GreA/GreB family factor
VKEKILKALEVIINERISDSKEAMDRAQESANSEGKSSAGDKYETSRAMGQIDRDMYARQLANAQNERAILQNIDITKPSLSVGFGSLVNTSAGYFFISVSVGKIEIDKKTILAVSSSSPIGVILRGKMVGDGFLFLGKEQKVLSLE